MPNQLTQLISIKSFLDLIAVYAVVFTGLSLIKDIRLKHLFKLAVFAMLCYGLAQAFELRTFEWLIDELKSVIIIVAIVIFQPELRRMFEHIRLGKLLSTDKEEKAIQSLGSIKHILTAVDTLSNNKMGAIIVISFKDSLKEYIKSGILINGELSTELLISLFMANSPTHDGAVIITERTIVAAGCLLPLTESKVQDRRLGTRHRSAIGLSEVSDALVITVSEESGTISLAENGNITRYLNREALETRLFSIYQNTDGAQNKD
ncbi:MAG: diadenylate cyclase CdaA [bacterium]|nr:diadenylate cyclase CdaA [bacterium]